MDQSLKNFENAGLVNATCCDNQTLAALEFPQLLEIIASLTQSPLGGAFVRQLKPTSDMGKITRRMRRLSQLRELAESSTPCGLEGLEAVRSLLPRLEVDGVFFNCEELITVCSFLSSVSRAASFLAPSENVYDEVYRLANRLTPLPKLSGKIRKLVGPGGSVSSSASSKLASIRRELASKRDGIRSQLQGYFNAPGSTSVFSDRVVTQRADRFVVPVKADSKGRISGIIHDTSKSGATCFVEPLDVVEENNHLALLRQKEHEEEIRILVEATRELALNLQVLYENLETLIKLDCLLAQVRFSEKLDACEPRLESNGHFVLEKARHPLLAWKGLLGKIRVVPIDLIVNNDTSVLIISGANAGGKTATLKTAGIITLMAMCGLHVPVRKGSLVSIFDSVAAEIGDEQDLDRQLSTFTAHAGRLAYMTQNAKPRTLYLIDEIGGGTDPEEGSSLAMAVLERIKRLGATVLATTHFHRLKAFAALTQGIENVSVTFDPKSHLSTYQLHYGAPGLSDALTVSQSLGFPESVIRRAFSFMDESEKQTVALLRQAQDARRLAASELLEAKKATLAAQKKQEKIAELLKAAQKERANALAEGKRRVRDVAKRMEGMLNNLLLEIENKKQKGAELKLGREKQKFYSARRKAIEDVEKVTIGASNVEKSQSKISPINQGKDLKPEKGMKVKVASLGQKGVILETPLPDAQTVSVSVGVTGVRVVVALKDLELTSQANSEKQVCQRKVSVRADSGDGLDLKVVGYTIDEAIPLVDKALDQALLAGRAELRVVHGMGTGRLKTAVRKFLSEHPCVASTRNEAVRRGGQGVTIAELRE